MTIGDQNLTIVKLRKMHNTDSSNMLANTILRIRQAGTGKKEIQAKWVLSTLACPPSTWSGQHTHSVGAPITTQDIFRAHNEHQGTINNVEVRTKIIKQNENILNKQLKLLKVLSKKFTIIHKHFHKKNYYIIYNKHT